jgi:segregation and condensation protein B
MSNDNFKFFKNVVEAIIFSSSDPVRIDVLEKRIPPSLSLGDIFNELSKDYLGRGILLEKTNHSWAFRTAPEVSEHLTIEKIIRKPLSRPALETLSIIAYHQPVTRTEIEDIRGVGISKGTLDLLLELDWIKPKGRRQSPGRPLTWGTTDVFLDVFGLQDLSSLPGLADLKSAGLVGSKQLITEDLSKIEESNEADQKNLIEELGIKTE